MLDNTSLVFVVINYFNDEDTIHFIKQEIKKQKIGPSIIAVLNNGSDDVKKLKLFCEPYPEIIFLDSEKNMGYIGGFLFAFARLKTLNPKWVILSNSDIQFSSEFFIEDFLLKNYLDDFVIIGPSIISSRTKHNQNPFYRSRISLTKLKLLNFIFNNYISYFFYQLFGIIKNSIKSFSETPTQKRTQSVYAVHGSFIIMRAAFIEKYFDEIEKAPFLFGEEITLSEIALKHNKKIIFDPSLKIIHHEHSTTGLFKSIKSVQQLRKSVATLLENRLK